MSLNAIALAIELYTNDECTALLLDDTTGLYSADNLQGYNRPGGASLASVDLVTVTLTYVNLATDLVYVFTVANGVITAATAGLAGATPTNIFAQLESTVWPLTNFDLTDGYGLTVPEFEDSVYTVEYVVEGTEGSDDYEYSTEESILNSCAACCCISKALVAQDINNINETTLTGAMRAKSYLETAQYALDAGDTAKANQFLIKAAEICDCDCDC